MSLTEDTVDSLRRRIHRLEVREEPYGKFGRGGTVLNPTAPVNIIVWRAPFNCTAVAVKGYRVGGTGATVNARKNNTDNLLATAVSLTTTDEWIDGGAVQNTDFETGDELEIMVVTADASPTQIAVQVDFVGT